MKKIFVVKSSHILIGRSCICDISFANNEYVSSSHIEIRKNENFDEVIMHGKNGGYVADVFLRRDDKKIIEYGELIKLPDISILWLHDIVIIGSVDDTCISSLDELSLDRMDDLEIDESEYDFFISNGNNGLHNNAKASNVSYSSHATVCSVPINNEPIDLEPPPEKRVEDPQGILLTIGPAFTMAVPMIIGFIVTYIAGKSNGSSSQAFMYTGLITAIGSATFGSIWAGLNIKNRQNASCLKEQNRQQAYYKYVKESESRIKDRYLKNRNFILLSAPSLSDRIANITSNQYTSLASDLPILIRLGTGRIESNIKINIPKEKFSLVDDDLKALPQILKDKYKYFYDVPICIDLNRHNTVGIIDDNTVSIYHTLMNIILSLALTYSPPELKMVLIIKNTELYELLIQNLIFLQHFWVNDDVLIGNKAEDIINQINTGANQLKTVIITDCIKEVSKKIKSKTIVSDKETNFTASNIIYIIPANNFQELPDICSAVIQKEHQFNGLIYLDDPIKRRQEIFFDSINSDLYKKYICEIAAISDISNLRKKDIPNKIGLLKVHALDLITDDVIKNMWHENTCFESISIPIGVSEYEEIIYLDFHEKKYGPHGILSGMTGSGKSEILQTIIIGLAMRYHPDNVSFFLIDYKGGGMSMMFEGIPHIKGSISNLAGSMVRRAITSIKTENEIRQRLFNNAKVNNIYDYQRKYLEDSSLQPIPHLFIIVDEFAELKREQPDFIKDLISVSRVGRSLGIHLILATQKPGGVIDDNILSNSRFRICLKVQDKMDSKELLGKYDAAYITVPGRAFLQVGNGEVYKEFQSAYTMSPYNDSNHEKNNVTFINETGTPLFTRCNSEEKYTVAELDAVKECIINVTKMCGYIRGQKMWLDPLPNRISLSKMDSCNETKGRSDSNHKGIKILKYDSLSGREQKDFYYNFETNGHLLILGCIASGKSNLLKVISYEITSKYNANFYNLYYLDFGSNRLKVFKQSNMCGGYFSEDNMDDIEKLFIMFEKVILERKKLLNGGDFNKFHSDNANIPAFVIFIDSIGTFREKTNCNFDATLLNVLKNGPSFGIYFVISATSISTSEMPSRMAEQVKTIIPLKLNDKYMYSQILKVSSEKIIEINDVPGRGLIKIDDEVVEFQAYSISETEDELTMDEEIMIEIKHVDVVNKSVEPAMKVPIIPLNPTVNHLAEDIYNEKKDVSKVSNKTDIYYLPVGYDERSGNTYYLPIKNGRNVIISGKAMTGKTEFLKTIVYVARELGFVAREITSEYENVEIQKDGVKAIIAVYEEDYGFKENDKWKKFIGNSTYVVHMGGCLDRTSVADFSYVPYLKQSVSKPAGRGTVRKNAGDEFYGDVIIARCVNDRELINQ